MTRARINYWVDIVALVSALVVFSTGLIVLTRFHMGPHGVGRLSGFGVSRMGWINLHRWAAVAMTAAVTVHAQLHWRTIVARVRRRFLRLPGKATRSDLVLYFGSLVTALASFAAWLVLPRPLQHPAVDIHNIAGLMLLTSAVTHVRRHLAWLWRWTMENFHASQQWNLRNSRPSLVERRCRF